MGAWHMCGHRFLVHRSQVRCAACRFFGFRSALPAVKKPQLMTCNIFVHWPGGQHGCFCGFRGPAYAKTKEKAAQWPLSWCRACLCRHIELWAYGRFLPQNSQLRSWCTFMHRPEGQCGCFCDFRGQACVQTKEQAAQWRWSWCRACPCSHIKL